MTAREAVAHRRGSGAAAKPVTSRGAAPVLETSVGGGSGGGPPCAVTAVQAEKDGPDQRPVLSKKRPAPASAPTEGLSPLGAAKKICSAAASAAAAVLKRAYGSGV